MSSLQETREQLDGAVQHYNEAEEAVHHIKANAPVEAYTYISDRAATLRSGLGEIATAAEGLAALINSVYGDQRGLDSALYEARFTRQRTINTAVDSCTASVQDGRTLTNQALGDNTSSGPAQAMAEASQGIETSTGHISDHVDGLWTTIVQTTNYLNEARHSLGVMRNMADDIARTARSAGGEFENGVAKSDLAEAHAQVIGGQADLAAGHIQAFSAAEQQYLTNLGAAE